MSEITEGISPQEVLGLLKGRRSIRRYHPDPVPEEMIEQLLEAYDEHMAEYEGEHH